MSPFLWQKYVESKKLNPSVQLFIFVFGAFLCVCEVVPLFDIRSDSQTDSFKVFFHIGNRIEFFKSCTHCTNYKIPNSNIP